jgi:hypothetical protein
VDSPTDTTLERRFAFGGADVVDRQFDQIVEKRSSDTKQLTRAFQLSALAPWVLLLAPIVVTFVVAQTLSLLVATVSAFVVGVLLFFAAFFLSMRLNEPQFFVLRINCDKKVEAQTAEREERCKHDPRNTNNQNRFEPTLLPKSRFSLVGAKQCISGNRLARRVKRYFEREPLKFGLTIGLLAFALYSWLAIMSFLDRKLLLGTSQLALSLGFLLFFVAASRLLEDISRPVSALEHVDYHIAGRRQLHAHAVLPKKVHTGDSHNISLMMTARDMGGNSTSDLHSEDAAEHLLVELQASGVEVAGQHTVPVESLGSVTIWNCYFPKAGSFTINLAISHVQRKEKVQTVFFTREHFLKVVSPFNVFWQPVLGTLLSIVSIISSAIIITGFFSGLRF